MLLRIERKGKKVFMNSAELEEYMSAKLNELSGLISNMVIALTMVSLVVVFHFFKAPVIYLYAIFLIPFIARWYLGGIVNKWLRKKFIELLVA